ncbi:MAG: sensory box histidine kinase/response regulator [Labilithrix sp.]|nr:sensory box histidine kinase/response regulator [Labilithrix sp.]
MPADPLRSLVDALPIAACVHRDGHVLYANAAFATALGFADAATLAGKSVADELLVADDRAMVEGRWRALSVDTPTLPAADIRWRCSDGGGLSMRTSAALMPFEGASAIVELGPPDGPQRPAAPQPFAPVGHLGSVVSLAAGVGHEINNPLTYVLANIDCLREQLRNFSAKLPPAAFDEIDEIAAEAKQGAERVARIVHSLKIFSRVEEEQRTPADIHAVVEAACALASNEIRHRARLVKIYRPVPKVEANDARLTLVFFNVFINAAQAIAEGRADENQIDVKTWAERGRAIVEVRDTGCGIDAKALPRIFDPFFTTKEQGVGTGLGLSVCHGIVSALGGEITVETTLAVGTTVRVSLPGYSGVTAQPAAVTRISSPNDRSGRILVVDDDASVCTAIRRTLGRRHQIVTTTSGREAIDRIAAGERYDLILCDLMMPVVTGMEVHAEILRRAPEQAERMVFITGGAFTPAAREFLRSVSNERFEKPFDGGRLRMLAKEMVDDEPPPK